MTPRPDPPSGIPTAAAVMGHAGGENFPVASRVLPRSIRGHLLALYGFARLVDELGDADDRPPACRSAALDWLEGELERAFAGEARNELLVRLTPTLRACALPREPFLALIEANRVDQRVARYETWQQLLDYCKLSANPVGELVLRILDRSTPERVALSDRICTALQLAEHWQDIAEDLARDRVYLPAEDLERFGCSEDELRRPHASERLRRLLAFEVTRTRRLLREGAPLIDELRGRERLAVAAFVSGGRAALDAIERAGYDVLAGPPRAGRSPIGRARRASALARTLWERRGRPPIGDRPATAPGVGERAADGRSAKGWR
jgi:squalene synthase HpnC